MRSRLIAAFAAVYLVWGSTYLAIRYAVQTLPPMLMVGTRFLIAGAALLLWARWREGRRPTLRDWRTGLISGSLMLAGGNGAVVWAEQKVPSGIAALLVAVVPVWMVLLDWLRPDGRRPRAAVFAGLALGLIGVGLLVGPDALHGDGVIDLASAGVLMVGSLLWAVASLYTQRAPRATSGSIGSSTQMLAGGLVSLLVGVLRGEPGRLDLAHVSTVSLVALAHSSAAKASTYAYVNPVVAVFLGWFIASEPVTARTLVAAAVILGGVAIITLSRQT
jgi:drug/metabolite transporter (DMT)-like permease